MKILCLHGVNTNEISTPPPFWYADWQDEIKNQLPDFRNSLEFAEYAYNTHFNQASLCTASLPTWTPAWADCLMRAPS